MKHTLGTILLFIIGVGLLGGIARFIYDVAGSSSAYKAVLITGGDVYFAKVDDGFGRYVVLRDIYYPQLVQAGEDGQQEIRIIKFGSELHGPRDEMRVNRDHVIMLQELRDDSQVIATIASLKRQGRSGGE